MSAPRPMRAPKWPPPQVVASPRVRALDPAGLGRFWAEVERRGTPLVEEIEGEPDHRIVTFLWRGGAGTREVILMANKLTDPSVWAESALEPLEGTDVWHRSYRLRADWRATYHLAVDDGRASGRAPAGPGRRWGRFAALAIADPLNPRTFPARADGVPLSIVELPDAPAQPWCEPRPGVPAGAVTEHRIASEQLGNARTVWVYEPPGSPAGPLPVAVLLDGREWARRLPGPTILDNLIADGRIPPLVALMPDALDSSTRWRELACHEPFLRFLADELLPWAAGRWPLAGAPDRAIVAGHSLGGLTAAFAGLCAPDRFGNVLAQSASLWAPEPGWLMREFATAPRRAVRFHLEVGLQEWIPLPLHRHLRDVLHAKGYAVTHREYNGGHDALCWQGGLADGLIALAG